VKGCRKTGVKEYKRKWKEFRPLTREVLENKDNKKNKSSTAKKGLSRWCEYLLLCEEMYVYCFVMFTVLHMPPAKSGEDGRHHMVGDLQLAPTAVFRTNFKQIETLLEQGGGAKLVILVPMPRYVRNPCCGDSGHVTNQGEKDFNEEFLGAEKRLLDAAAAGTGPKRQR
jgi:hypothetical protein